MAYLSYEQIACSDTTVRDVDDLTIPANATHVELQAANGGDVAYTMDGTSVPSAGVGMLLQTGADPKLFLVDDLRKIKFVKNDGSTSLNIHYIAGRDI